MFYWNFYATKGLMTETPRRRESVRAHRLCAIESDHHKYPLVNIQKTDGKITMFEGTNQLLLWSYSIAMLVYQRVPLMLLQATYTKNSECHGGKIMFFDGIVAFTFPVGRFISHSQA